MFYEMITLGQQNDQIAAEMAELGRRTRTQLADELNKKVRSGAIVLKHRRRDGSAVHCSHWRTGSRYGGSSSPSST